jgi:hypothetical protein
MLFTICKLLYHINILTLIHQFSIKNKTKYKKSKPFYDQIELISLVSKTKIASHLIICFCLSKIIHFVWYLTYLINFKINKQQHHFFFQKFISTLHLSVYFYLILLNNLIKLLLYKQNKIIMINNNNNDKIISLIPLIESKMNVATN